MGAQGVKRRGKRSDVCCLICTALCQEPRTCPRAFSLSWTTSSMLGTDTQRFVEQDPSLEELQLSSHSTERGLHFYLLH